LILLHNIRERLLVEVPARLVLRALVDRDASAASRVRDYEVLLVPRSVHLLLPGVVARRLVLALLGQAVDDLVDDFVSGVA